MKIDKDHQRFRQIIKGHVRKELRKFVANGEMIGQQGGHLISIPVPSIQQPKFRYGDNREGLGQGEGEPGDSANGEKTPGNQGGTDPGRHIMQVELTLDELADILGEELQLPRIEPKGEERITDERLRYRGIRSSGPESLRHLKRTFKEALKREMLERSWDRNNPRIIIQRPDTVYRSWKTIREPQSNALVIYMMDVSGSMQSMQKDIVRTEAFWIDTWLRRNYEGIESRYIVHDVRAAEVDREKFFGLREDGGTRISSAFKVARELMETKFNPSTWNIYLFYFSDGDNSSESDSQDTCRQLREWFMERINMVAYSQVRSEYGSGNFYSTFTELLKDEEKAVAAKIESKDDIIDVLKKLFARGL